MAEGIDKTNQGLYHVGGADWGAAKMVAKGCTDEENENKRNDSPLNKGRAAPYLHSASSSSFSCLLYTSPSPRDRSLS
eukprot:9065795-Pyramimonas_sp.AAC.1